MKKSIEFFGGLFVDYFISDTHFCGVRRFGEDKYKNNEERDKGIIKNWQERVSNDDNVYIIGDFCESKDVNVWKDIVAQLPGKLYLIRGNHELMEMPDEAISLFEWVKDYAEIDIEGYTKVILSHYPLIFYKYDQDEKMVHLHGHVHLTKEGFFLEKVKRMIKEESLKKEDNKYFGRGNFYNVGCMCPWMDFTPRTLNEIVSAKVNIEDYNYPYQVD